MTRASRLHSFVFNVTDQLGKIKAGPGTCAGCLALFHAGVVVLVTPASAIDKGLACAGRTRVVITRHGSTAHASQ